MDIYKDKVAFITGAASGIGKALAQELSRRGAKMILTDLNQEILQETLEGIKASGGQASGQVLDVTDYEEFEKQIKQVVETHGRLDYLFNNAGIAIAAEMRDLEIEHWRKVIDVDLHGVFHGSLAAYKLMVEQGFGHIVNLSSIEGMIPFPSNAPYVASKYAVLGLSQTMWVEGAALGVKTSAVCPGFIRTAIFDVSPMINIDREKMMAQYETIEKLGISAEKCARVILKGVAKNKPVIPVSGLAHVIWRLCRLIPISIMKYSRKDFDKWRDLVRTTQ
jgi:NAD(P)-dependent dehydrogenase (short-subunit alcohol dehydrogenase family)